MASATLNVAVVAPIPNAKVRTAVAAKPGEARKVRMP
jgi:hypothetical protein